MEYLDSYDENGNFLGKETKDYVHKNALWHNTVHCWLYDSDGKVYFQIRAEDKKFYTTASGHVLAGETIKEAFGREVKEEIGLDIDYEKAELVRIVIWKMDKEKPGGIIWRDRAFANVHVCRFDEHNVDFDFGTSEVIGVVKVDAKQALELFKNEKGKMPAEVIINENGKNVTVHRDVDFNEFLVQKHETAIEKYGFVLDKIIELT